MISQTLRHGKREYGGVGSVSLLLVLHFHYSFIADIENVLRQWGLADTTDDPILVRIVYLYTFC